MDSVGMCYILLLLYHTLCSQQLYARMGSNLADGGAKLLKQEDDIAARMRKLRGRVPTTVELVAMVQENEKKAAVEEVKQKVCGTSIQLVPVDTDGTVLYTLHYLATSNTVPFVSTGTS